ncbi:secondary thiamine-phosphate synthase enzyme YjbQ [Methanobacterium alcaliphilum]|uniref:secondary thiamine-phosphate synthase enzyme YjbQ n=1 Tax=Methanobacterium alcaliphilum TaxID=392018 RepID=UPI00200AA85B|nr:secondary thiamine-phosphate synthase enzyme YjbQ [Methanobacterium alcaliphilum]MCK9150824.1 secondary thiamine-phosphate synthase enzyme YjbQ [Methanobacterium alcaliphilum]
MKIIKDSIELKTIQRLQLLNISSQLERAVKSSGIKEGIISVFTRHSTSGIIINENEPRLLGDIENTLERLIPEIEVYGHNSIDNNADSHLKAVFLGGSQTIPIENNQMDLGTWQSIFFVELDGPRNRKVKITLMGQ